MVREQRTHSASASKSDAIAVLVAVAIVQWFVVNLMVALGRTGSMPDILYVLRGLRRAVFMELPEGEEVVIVTVGMLVFPVLVGIEYGAGALTRIARRKMGCPVGSFPHWRVLKANWIWILYWPLWLWAIEQEYDSLFASCWLWITGQEYYSSLPVSYGGLLAIPPLLAVAIGVWGGFRAAEPQP